MAIWLVRAGRHGEYESRFIQDARIYLTWHDTRIDLGNVASREEMYEIVRDFYPDAAKGRITNNGSQWFAFASRIKVGDWVLMPSKARPVIHVGEVKSAYRYDGAAEDPYFHAHDVNWFATEIPRSRLDQDLLYSLGAFMTVCQINRNNAEARIKALVKGGPVVAPPSISTESSDPALDSQGTEDPEEIGRIQIAARIQAQFKGHGMERLVEAVLRAQGYSTYHSPEGADKGVDLLAAPGSLGFGHPRICVQVKSQDGPVDSDTLDRLIGTMQRVHAEHGLLVAWGGFKSSVNRQEADQFFRVRLWDQTDLMDQIFANYENLGDEIRAELPLKRIWTVALDPDAP